MNPSAEDIIHLIMAAPSEGPDMHRPDMKPGKHGPTRGPEDAVDLLMTIRDMLNDYFATQDEKMPKEEEKPEEDEEEPMKEEDDEL